MGLEAATYIADLVATNPTSGDPKSQGDDHLRLLKTVLQSSFAFSDGANGYLKLGGSLILQWGQATMGAGSSAAVTWPIAFTTACRAVVAMDIGSNIPIGTSGGATTTGVTFSSSGTPGTFNWIAIGV
jgi:hypothetical protein